MAAALGVLVTAGLLVGCGDDVVNDVSGFDSASVEYAGPLYVADDRFGAAGAALDCRPAAGSFEDAEVYAEGATSDSVEQALETAVSEGLFLFAPTDEVRLAKTERDRALLVHEVEDRILMALVFRNGPATEGAGGPGWYLESAARCDFAEFPEAFAEWAGYRLWRDGAGEAVPVTEVYSAPGPEHCDWQSMEFLHLDDRDAYVHEPIAEIGRFLTGPFRDGITLPADARDTGYEREGRHLWVSAEGRYAYVGTPGDLEAWPRFDAGCA